MVKPTSKPIQILTHTTSAWGLTEEWIVALCEDGSIWKFTNKWECVLEPINKN